MGTTSPLVRPRRRGAAEGARLTLALVYVRQSDHKRYERTTSPEVQRETCLVLPAVKACDTVEVFEDLGVSGGKLKGRKAFDKLMARIKTGSVAVVAAYDQSRAFRNTLDALNFYALMESRADITVVFVHGQFDRSPVGGFSYSVLAAAHEMERRMTGEKIKASKRRASALGLPVGEIPAGYRWDSEGRERRLVVDEPIAAVVQRIFREYAQGRRTTEIARRLNAEGLRFPTMAGEWRWSQVNAVLRNVAYHGQTYSGSRDKREGELIDAQWPALVDDEVWTAVRTRSDARRAGNGRGAVRPYVFRGLLRCSCGARLHVNNPKPGYVYYVCRQDGSSARDACTNRAWVREAALLPWARGVFELADTDRQRPASLSGTGVEAATRRRRAQPDALASIDLTIARLGKRYEWGHLDEAVYQLEWERLQTLRSEILAAGRTPGEDTLERELRGALALWDAAANDPDVRRRMLLALFEELDIRDGTVVGWRPREDRAARVYELLGGLDGAVRFG